jgi:hypothetical protein
MASFNMKSQAYAKNVMKIVDILSTLSPTIVSWYSLYSKKIQKFGELSGGDMIYTIGAGNIIKEWMFAINKIKINGKNDIRKFNNSPEDVKYYVVSQLFSNKERIQQKLKVIKVLTNNDCEEWTDIVNRFDLVDSQFPNVNKKYWEMFKYFCGGTASEHCSCTHVECARSVITGLIQNTISTTDTVFYCKHCKFGDLIDGLIYILETALENINEMEKERGYILYTGHHQLNDAHSLFATLPIELVRKINVDASVVDV